MSAETTPAPAAAVAWTAERVHQALHDHFTRQGWHLLEEVTCEDPDAHDQEGRWRPGATAARRIDVLALRTPKRATAAGVPLGVAQLLAIEIKVTRADFVADVAHPEKQAPWRNLAHQHAYAVPEGLVDPAEVPDGHGLLVIERESYLRWGGRHLHAVRWAKKAPYTHGGLPPEFVRHFAGRAARAEARLRGRDQSGSREDPADLRAELERVKHQLDLVAGRAERERAAAARWRQIAVSGGYPVACATCGHPVRPTSVRTHWEQWRHVYPEHDPACAQARAVAGGRWPLSIEPVDVD